MIDDEPVDLTARFARLALLPPAERTAEASALTRNLDSGFWPISRPTYEYYRAALARFVPVALGTPAWEDAADALVKTSGQPGMEAGERVIWIPAAGSSESRTHSQPVLLIWRSQTDRVAGLAVTGAFIANHWLTRKAGFTIGLETADGRSLVPAAASGRTAERILSFAGAHWRLIASDAGTRIEQNGSGTLLLAGLLSVIVLVLAGSIAVIQAVSRELSVAQLQTDFVSAVSHDFRTPLTTLRSMSEMLQLGRVPSEERKRRYYEVMAREIGRLQRLDPAVCGPEGARNRMPRILIAEDEPGIAMALEDDLTLDGYEVEVTVDGAQALCRAREGGFDLIILDVMLPRKNGFDVCREARRSGITAPILLLTARSAESDKIMGLDLGADDYLTKPFSLHELRARIRSLLRRGSFAPPVGSIFRFGDVEVNSGRGEVKRKGQLVEMSALEFKLLGALIKNRGRLLSRERLLEEVWGRGITVTERVVDNQILSLRKKIEVNPAEPRILISVRGLGYRFDPDPNQ